MIFVNSNEWQKPRRVIHLLVLQQNELKIKSEKIFKTRVMKLIPLPTYL